MQASHVHCAPMRGMAQEAQVARQQLACLQLRGARGMREPLEMLVSLSPRAGWRLAGGNHLERHSIHGRMAQRDATCCVCVCVFVCVLQPRAQLYKKHPTTTGLELEGSTETMPQRL
jgi:hypothetical protein